MTRKYRRKHPKTRRNRRQIIGDAGSVKEHYGNNKRIKEIIMGTIGPYKKHCAAFGNPSGPKTPNYINICKLGLGKMKIDASTKQWDTTTKGILAYDRAETDSAYLGQVNVISASSFIGPSGALWGYDLANNTHNSTPMYSIDGIPIYNIHPLLEAGEALFGTNQQTTRYFAQSHNSKIGPRFYVMPGEILPCAVKNASLEGSGVIWSAIGIGIPTIDLSDKVARLFYEDAGFFKSKTDPAELFVQECSTKLERKMHDIATAMIRNGQDQVIPLQYSKIFIGFRMMPVMHDEFAQAITLSPYITLAKDAFPSDPKDLASMSLHDWERLKFPISSRS